jgi:DNA-binding CsgD family transcriptional regulator
MEWSYLERILQVGDEASLWRESERFARDHGFDRYSYVRCDSAPGRSASLYARHNYHSEYWDLRTKRLGDREDRTDPVKMHVSLELPPTAWSCRGEIAATRSDIAIAAQDLLLNGISDFGIRAGVTIPLGARGAGWGYMGFTTAGTSQTRDLLPLIAATHTYSHFVQAALRRLGGRVASPALTAREREVLRWSALGKSTWEISRILSISESTVEFHVTGATRRLGVRGRRAAVARAMALGLIQI